MGLVPQTGEFFELGPERASFGLGSEMCVCVFLLGPHPMRVRLLGFGPERVRLLCSGPERVSLELGP